MTREENTRRPTQEPPRKETYNSLEEAMSAMIQYNARGIRCKGVGKGSDLTTILVYV